MKPTLVFVTFAADAAHLRHALLLAESLRTFGGAHRESPVRIHAPGALIESQSGFRARAEALGATIQIAEVRKSASRLPFANKVAIAAQAEAEEAGRCEILVLADADTIVLREPSELSLPAAAACGFRPVMHRLIGSEMRQPVDAFWKRLYRTFGIPEDSVFPVTTPTDRIMIRAYFTAGIVAVRPERGLLRRWKADFAMLSREPFFVSQCAADPRKRAVLHQVALTATLLRSLGPKEMVQLSEAYNYPIFFDRRFESATVFDSLEGVATLRYHYYFENPEPGWASRLKGPADVIAWLASRLGGPAGEASQ